MLERVCVSACNGYYDDFIKNLITFSAVHEMLLSNIIITSAIFQRNTYLRVKKKNVKKCILGKMCKPGLFGGMVATRLEVNP